MPILFVIFLMLLFFACSSNNKELEKQLSSIQRRGDDDPVTALKLLKSSEQKIKDAQSENLLNKYLLLHVRLCDKSNIIPVSADTISGVCNYFEKHGTDAEKAEAHYYLASVFRDLQDYPQAITHFLMSEEYAQDTSNADEKLLINIYSQLSYLYKLQYNYDESLNSAIKELEQMERMKLEDAITVMDVATAYAVKGDTTRSLLYCDRALDIIRKSENPSAYADITAELLSFYAKVGNHQGAQQCYNRLTAIPKDERPHNYYYGIADYYNAYGPVDSVYKAYKTLYDSAGTWFGVAYSSKALMNYLYDIGNYSESCKFALDYQDAYEHYIEEKQLALTARAKGEYVYHRNKEAEMQAIAKASRMQVRLWTCVSLSAIIMALLSALYVMKRRKSISAIIAKEQEIQSVQQLLVKRDMQLVQLNKDLEELDGQFHQKEEDIKKKLSQINVLMKVAMLDQEIDKGSEVIEKFRMVVGNPQIRPSAKDWKKLFSATNQMYPDFIQRVQIQLPKINTELLRTCCLVKLGFSNPEISFIMDTPRQTVWHRVTKLRNQLGELLNFSMNLTDEAESVRASNS